MLRFKKEDGSSYPEWKIKLLPEIAALINGRAYKSDEMLIKGKYPLLRVGNLFTNDNLLYSDLELEENKYINEGDLIYAWSATFGPRIFHGERTIYHYHIWKIETADDIDKTFLYYILLNDVKYIKRELNGGTMQHITKMDMEKRSYAIPSMEEQKKISDFLTEIDNVIECSEKEIKSLEQQKKGLIQKIFSQEIRFKRENGDFYLNWNKIKLKKLIKITTGYPFDSKLFTEEDNGNPIIRIRNISDCSISLFTTEEYDDKYLIKKNDIIIGMDGDFLIRKWKNINVGLNQRIMKIESKNSNLLLNSFLYYAVQLPIYNINGLTPSTTVKHLSNKDVENIVIELPCLEEQQKIAEFLSSFDETIDATKEELETWKNIKKGLLQQMFE